MKKYLLAIIVFAIGLAIADYYFGMDVEELLKGFSNFVLNIIKGGKS